MSSNPSTAAPSTAERILDAAAAVFAEHGFGGARVEAIAARAGVNKAMLYYHVGDKAELYAAVLTRNLERAHRRLQAAAAQQGTARQRLHGVILALAQLVEEIPHHPRIMLREIASGADHLPDRVVARMRDILALVGALLREGAASGELRPADPLLTHLLILGAVTFMTATRPLRARVQAVAPEPAAAESPRHLADFVAAVLLDGLAAARDTR